MKRLDAGSTLDGFVIGECIHAGGMAHIYQVRFESGAEAGFPMAMKVPQMSAGDGAENIVSFEVEHQMLQVLSGAPVPRFVAAGDLERVPYLVMEYVEGRTLQHWLDQAIDQGRRPDAALIARLGAATATAVHQLHRQNAVHLDLKPANVIIRADGSAALLDFGLSWHAHLPDLLAEELRRAVGSPAYMAPEQVVGVRGDPRSDLFAIGVMLYELATGELPFGAPSTSGGLRQRLWMDPRPPRALRPDLPEWLQEIILRCLEPEAVRRYPSGAHLAFDLSHPDQVQITDRGRRLQGTGAGTHLKRWIRAAGMQYTPSPLPSRQIDEVPIVMVAVPWKDVTDATLYSLRQAVQRSLGIRPGARLACVTVADRTLGDHALALPALAEAGSVDAAGGTDDHDSETGTHRRLLAMLRHWAQPLDLGSHQTSYHVLDAGDVAQALLDYAQGNHVSMIVMGAATHGLKLQPFIHTVPIKVAMAAPCTVILVKQELPFGTLATAGS